ncbi:MAG TPA: tetratricopeptide repeat protein [Pirellulales bacterium]
MSPHLQRAELLLQQQRTDLALDELRLAIAEEPNNAYAHSLAALCLLKMEKFNEATQAAQLGIGLAPDRGFTHYVLSEVMQGRNRLAEAKTAIDEAIRLEPDEAEFFGELAGVELQLRNWPGALAAAENGLKIDPEHVVCTNLRVQALTKLGRRTDADAAVEAALRKAPENAYTHANRGWTLLEQGNPAKAMEHFREALRLNPNLDWARSGIVESLKARHFVYRWMLKYFFWMTRLSGRAQWGVMVGAWLLVQIVDYLGKQSPALAPVTRPIVVAYVVFAVLTWLSRPLFNTLLRFNRFGRLVLSTGDKWQSNVVCLFLLPALATGIMYAVLGMTEWGILAMLAAITLGLMSVFISNVFNCSAGWPRWTMLGGSMLFLICSCVTLVRLHSAFFSENVAVAVLQAQVDAALDWHTRFVTPLALALFIGGNWLMSVRVKR